MMHRKAFAKITFVVSTLGKIDGKVQFENVIVPIDLFDSVYLETSDEMVIETNKSYLPNDQRNTVFQAIRYMKERYHIEDNFKVTIIKNIPAQSGLGGGSADAAAVIQMMNERYALNLDRDALVEIASQIDEDTPYCLFNEPALVKGHGEHVIPLELSVQLYYVLVKPAFGMSTKSFLRKQKIFEAKETLVHNISEAMALGDVDMLYRNTFNVFQSFVSKTNYRMKFVVRDLKRSGLNGVCMTGTGTAVYGLTTDKQVAMQAFETLVSRYPFVKYGAVNQSHGLSIAEVYR